MAKLTLQLHKLENPTVTHISLVQRAASRIPFRIIKQERDMIDLTKIFKKDASNAGAKPSIIGVIVEKHDGLDIAVLSAELAAAGFNAPLIDDNFENVTIFKSAESTDNSLLVRVSNHTLVMVDKAELPDLPLFSEELEAGFYVGLEYATDKLNNVTREAIAKNDTALATQATEDYNKYLTAYTAVMPELTFKLDEIVTKASKGKKAPIKGANGTDGDAEDKVDGGADDATENEDGTQVKAKKTDAEKTAEELAADALAAVVLDPVATPQELVTKFGEMLAELTTKMDTNMSNLQKAIDEANVGMAEKFSGIQTSVTDLSTKLNEVETVAKAANESVRGTVLGAPPAGDETQTNAKKFDDVDQRSGVFDTAYLSKPSRTARH